MKIEDGFNSAKKDFINDIKNKEWFLKYDYKKNKVLSPATIFLGVISSLMALIMILIVYVDLFPNFYLFLVSGIVLPIIAFGIVAGVLNFIEFNLIKNHNDNFIEKVKSGEIELFEIFKKEYLNNFERSLVVFIKKHMLEIQELSELKNIIANNLTPELISFVKNEEELDEILNDENGISYEYILQLFVIIDNKRTLEKKKELLF